MNMFRLRFRLAASVLVMGMAMFLSWHTPVAAEEEITVSVLAVDDSEFPSVTALVTADESGRPLLSLLPAEVQVTEGGVAAAVEAVVPATGAIPMALVITIDVSGSMEGAAMEQARAFAASLVTNLAPGDVAALVTFSDTVQVAQPFTSDHGALLAAINGLTASGNTALYDAVARSAELAALSDVTRRAVVIISDGEDFGARSLSTRDGSLASASTASTFYVVGVGGSIDRPYLQALAQMTAGRFFDAPAPAELPGIYASIEELLRAQYAITFRSAAGPLGADREVSIRIERNGLSGAASRSYQSLRPDSETIPTPTSVPSPTPTTVVTPPLPVASDDGGLPVAMLVIGGLVVAGAAPVLLLFGRRRRGSSRLPTIIEDGVVDESPLPAPMVTETMTGQQGALVITGPEFFERIPFGEAPITVGSGPSDTVRLPESASVAPQHVRLWLRDGALMLHHLAGGFETRVQGETVTWASVSGEEEVTVGPFSIRYERDRP